MQDNYCFGSSSTGNQQLRSLPKVTNGRCVRGALNFCNRKLNFIDYFFHKNYYSCLFSTISCSNTHFCVCLCVWAIEQKLRLLNGCCQRAIVKPLPLSCSQSEAHRLSVCVYVCVFTLWVAQLIIIDVIEMANKQLRASACMVSGKTWLQAETARTTKSAKTPHTTYVLKYIL